MANIREDINTYSAPDDPLITVIAGDGDLSTEVPRSVLVANSAKCRARLQNGETFFPLGDYDIETFNLVKQWFTDGTVMEIWDNEDVMFLMQAYDLAFSLEIEGASTAFLDAITIFVSNSRLNVHVINETAYIPRQCALRDFLLDRLLAELERFHDKRLIGKKIDDIEGSLWQDRRVAKAFAELTVRRQIDNIEQGVYMRPRKRSAKIIDEPFPSASLVMQPNREATTSEVLPALDHGQPDPPAGWLTSPSVTES